MFKQYIKRMCLKKKILHKIIYEPYSAHCEKRRQRLADEQDYRLNDPEYCLRGLQRLQGVNFWFLLEQGHNNIGDIAIGIAERRFFEKYYSDIPKHYIYEAVYTRYRREIAEQIRPGDVIILRGGGSIGNTVQHEKHREEIIRKYSENLIVSMPQTMCFPDTKKGKREKKTASKVYAGNRNLLLVAREEKSYLDMRDTFSKTRVILTPDIVMSIDCSDEIKKRDGILLCFRSDWEKNISKDEIQTIERICNALTGNVMHTDMYSEERFVSLKKKEEVFKRKVEQFKRASLVVTDRLHGMVFSAISGTPCIALSNYNHKVRETYKWLRNLPYISFCESVDEAINMIGKLYGINGTYNSDFTTPYLKQITRYIDAYLSTGKI